MGTIAKFFYVTNCHNIWAIDRTTALLPKYKRSIFCALLPILERLFVNSSAKRRTNLGVNFLLLLSKIDLLVVITYLIMSLGQQEHWFCNLLIFHFVHMYG